MHFIVLKNEFVYGNCHFKLFIYIVRCCNDANLSSITVKYNLISDIKRYWKLQKYVRLATQLAKYDFAYCNIHDNNEIKGKVAAHR